MHASDNDKHVAPRPAGFEVVRLAGKVELPALLHDFILIVPSQHVLAWVIQIVEEANRGCPIDSKIICSSLSFQ
jgi:hypothetical protein